MSKDAQRTGRTSSRKIRQLLFMSVIVAIAALAATAYASRRAKQAGRAQSNEINESRTTLTHQAETNAPLSPQTVQVRPLTQEEAQKLADGIKLLVNQSTDGLEPVRHTDGSVSIDLQGRFQNVAVAKLDENGKLTQSCVDNPAAAAAFFEIDPQLVGVKNTSASKTSSTPAKGSER